MAKIELHELLFPCGWLQFGVYASIFYIFGR